MKLLKTLSVLAGLCGCLLLPPAASAATCQLTSNGGKGLTADVNVATITAATNGAAGTVLASRDISLAKLDYTCGANVTAELRMAMAAGSASTAVTNVYSTSIPGLGFRIRWPSTTWWPNAVRCTATQSGNCSVPAGTVRVEFVQTGKIAAGTLPAGTLGTATLLASGTSSNQLTALTVALTTPIQIAVSSCAVTSDVRVDLGDYTVDELASKTGSSKVGFQLDFNCPSQQTVSITFNGTAPFGYGTSGLIANNGTAKGIAVQLLDSNGVSGVALGKKKSVGTFSGAKTVKYNARMYRLNKEDLTAGDVDAFAVFTLDIS